MLVAEKTAAILACSISGQIQFIAKTFDRDNPTGLFNIHFDLFSQQVDTLMNIRSRGPLTVTP